MAAPLKRGTNVALTQEIPQLTGVVLGVRVTAGSEQLLVDNLVVAALLCGPAGKVLSDRHFVFFNQLSSPDLSVRQLEGALGSDHEQIEIDLAAVPAEIAHIVVVLYLNDGLAQKRSLGQLKSCRIRVLDLATNAELVRSEELAVGLTTEQAMALGEMYRHRGGWKFKVIGEAYVNGITAIAADYGVPL